MNRRTFLKLSGLTSLAAALPVPAFAAPPAAGPVVFDGRAYRPGGQGRVDVSDDGGKTWRLHSDLGSDYVVSKLSVDRRTGLKVNVAFGQWAFGLTLGSDRRAWLTT